jgi:hypothetical protein
MARKTGYRKLAVAVSIRGQWKVTHFRKFAPCTGVPAWANTTPLGRILKDESAEHFLLVCVCWDSGNSVATILDENNRLFTLARMGRWPPSGLVAITVAFVMLVLALIPGQILSRLIVRLLPIGARSVAEPVVQNVAMFLPIYLGLWVWLQHSSNFWTLGLERQGAVQSALRGALIAGLMMALTAGVSIAPGASLTPGLWQTMGIAALGIRFLSLLGYFVHVPAAEVLFVRDPIDSSASI